MNQPKIQLQRIKFGPANTHEESLNFIADLFINDTRVGYATNVGAGESTLIRPYQPYDKNHSAICNADEYFKTVDTSLESHIDEIIEKLFNQREIDNLLKRVTKRLSTCLVMLSPEKDKAVEVNFKRPIEDFLKDPKKKAIIDKHIEELKRDYPSYILLNDFK